jgi:hypothetical protein
MLRDGHDAENAYYRLAINAGVSLKHGGLPRKDSVVHKENLLSQDL